MYQDLHGLAVACCTAAQILHAKGLVHRDLRMGNIVQRGPSQYLVIDLESVAWAVQAPLPHDFASVLRTCTPEALDDRRCDLLDWFCALTCSGMMMHA